MPKLSERKETKRFFGLFVGRHHSGKTVAEASFPKPSFFFDFDGRIGGASVDFLDLKGIDYETYPPKMPNLITKIDEKIQLIDEQFKMRMNGQSSGPFGDPPQTVVTDSITNMNFALICQSLELTHTKKGESGKEIKGGRWIGSTKMAGPEDYGLEAQATYNFLADLKTLPIPNVILSAHLVDVYDKQKDEDGEELPYAPSIVTGEKLSIRDKIGENIQTSFDNIFKFERKTQGTKDKFYVTFKGGIACSSYSWLPYGQHDWTGKNFYEFMLSFQPKKDENNKTK